MANKDHTPLSQAGQAVLALLQLAEISRQAAADLFTLTVGWNADHKRWEINGITAEYEEEAAIDAVRWWANALAGTVHLSEVGTMSDFRGGTRDYRVLEGRGEIAGVPVVISENLYDLAPASNAVPATV